MRASRSCRLADLHCAGINVSVGVSHDMATVMVPRMPANEFAEVLKT